MSVSIVGRGPDPATKGRLRVKQVEVLYDQAPVALSASLAAALVLVVVLWPVSPPSVLIAWLGALVLISSARVWLILRYRKATPEQRMQRPWRWWMIAGSAATGLLWGLATPLLPPPDSPIHIGFTTLWTCGLAAGAIASLSSVRWGFTTFLLPATLPAALFLFAQGGTPETTMGVGLLLFAAFLSFNGMRLHRSVTQSLCLQFENSALIAELGDEKRQIERLNAELEARVAQRTAELSAANAAKSRFLAAASHDLRQPLQALALLQGALANMIEEPAPRRVLSDMGEGIRVAGELLDALLDVTRLDGGGIKPTFVDLEVAQVFSRLERELRHGADQKGLALRVVPTRAVVRSDQALLERILRNLLSNAIKYTERGKILIGCRRHGDRVRIEVWDTGRGIPAEHLEHIFEEFYQLGNPARERGKGQGLGLAIVERTARLLGHPLSVRSTPGRGTVFALELPLGDPAAVMAPAPPPAPRRLARELRLALVEDDEDVQEAMCMLLGLHGFRVRGGRTSAEVLGQCGRDGFRPDLLIADYRLPDGETGFDAIGRLRGWVGRDLPAILLTGDMSPEVEQAAEKGGCRLLRKPIETQILIGAILESAGPLPA